MHMKSLMKSFSNGNFQFYENLHKKYFDKAKEEEKSQKPPTFSQNLERSDKDLFSLTSKTGTILGMSQLKQSIDSLKTSSRMIDDKPSILRASSLKANKSQMKDSDKENQGQNTMSINFKNSLYKKVNATSVFLDDQSQLLQSKEGVTSTNKLVYRGGIRMRKDYFDTSSSSSQPSSKKSRVDEEDNQQDRQRPMNLSKHIKHRQLEILGGDKQGKKRERSQNVL